MNSPPTSRNLFDDVRMRGFRRRSKVRDVTDWIDQHATTLPSESVELCLASGRILAEDIASEVNGIFTDGDRRTLRSSRGSFGPHRFFQSRLRYDF